MADQQPSNWRGALDARELETLRLIIAIVAEHEMHTGSVITPIQLRAVLERGHP